MRLESQNAKDFGKMVGIEPGISRRACKRPEYTGESQSCLELGFGGEGGGGGRRRSRSHPHGVERERGGVGEGWREEGRERQTETKKRTELNMFTVVHWATIIYVKELMNAASEKRLTLLIRV